MSYTLAFSRSQWRLLCFSAVMLGAAVGLISYALGGWLGDAIGNGIEFLLRQVK